jgi:integrase
MEHNQYISHHTRFAHGNFYKTSKREMACTGTERWRLQGPDVLTQTRRRPIPEGFTVGKLIELYSQECTTGGKTKTATLKMLTNQLGNVYLRKLNNVVLREFVEKRKAAGAGGVTISADLSYLSSVLKWARHFKRLDVHAELAVDARKSLAAAKIATRSQEREREPTAEELSALYKCWAANERQRIPMQQICEFALATAMRQEEICNLDFADLNIERRSIVVRDRKDPQRKQGNHQTVPLLPDAWEIVQEIMRERQSGKLFPYLASSVSTAFTRACKKLHIHDLRFHDLRHHATSQLVKSGLSISEVAVLTGHKTWTQLRRYTHINAEDVHMAYERLQKQRNKLKSPEIA